MARNAASASASSPSRKHQCANAAGTELVGAGAQAVDRLLHGVTDENQGADGRLIVGATGMLQNLFDLRVSADALDFSHGLLERLCIGHPLR